MIGAASVSHWSFPSTSTYTASIADNGNVVSSYNSPASFMAVTLPPTTVIPMGWTFGLATDNGKTMSVQVNGTSGGHILYPGNGAANSATLASGNYEFLVLRFDGSNFRVTVNSGNSGSDRDGGLDAGHQSVELPDFRHLCCREKRQRQRAVELQHLCRPDRHTADDDRDHSRLDYGICN